MSLRHAVLGLLAGKPSTGYELAGRFDQSLGHAWHASHSQIYPQLAQLQSEGLVEVVGEGPRRSKTYTATDAGRAELRRWMLEEEPTRTVRNETAVRWFLVGLLDDADKRRVYTSELAYMEEQATFMAELDRLVTPDSPFRSTIDLGLRTTPVMIDWLRQQLATLDP